MSEHDGPERVIVIGGFSQQSCDEYTTVFQAIHKEMEYQVILNLRKPWQHRNKPSVGEEILLIEEYLARARRAWTDSNDTTKGTLHGTQARCPVRSHDEKSRHRDAPRRTRHVNCNASFLRGSHEKE